MTESLMLSTNDAYLLAQGRGFSGSKEQLRSMARETPQVLERQYGLAYSSTPQFSRNAKNWRNMHPEDPLAKQIQVAKATKEKKVKEKKGGRRGRPPLAKNVAKQAAAPSSSPVTPVSVPSTSSVFTPSKQPVMTDIQNVSELAQVLSWFTREIDQLRQQIGQKPPSSGASISGDLAQLKSENESLKSENAVLHDKLNHVQKVLGVLDAEATAVVEPVVAAPTKMRKKRGAPKKSPQPVVKPTRAGRKSAPVSDNGVDPNVNLALEAIFNYNNQVAKTKDEKWAVSYPVMKDLLKQVGAATQPKIKQVFEVRRKDIDRHHQTHGLSSRHNRVHGDRSISDIIQLKAE